MLIGKTEVEVLRAGEELTLMMSPVNEHPMDGGLMTSLRMDPEAAAGLALGLMLALRDTAAWEGYRKGMIDALESWGEPRTIESDIAEGRI